MLYVGEREEELRLPPSTVSGFAPLTSEGGADLSPGCCTAIVVSAVLFMIDIAVLYILTSACDEAVSS